MSQHSPSASSPSSSATLPPTLTAQPPRRQVVFTGTLTSGRTLPQAKELAVKQGYYPADTVPESTTLLVCGDSPKRQVTQDAERQSQVRVISESEWVAEMQDRQDRANPATEPTTLFEIDEDDEDWNPNESLEEQQRPRDRSVIFTPCKTSDGLPDEIKGIIAAQVGGEALREFCENVSFDIPVQFWANLGKE